MREALQTIRGAVSTKDFIPVLTHVAIHKERVCGFNGRVYISAPAPNTKGLSLTVPAEQFIKAVESCTGEPQLSHANDVLTVAHENFSASLPTGKIEEFPTEDPLDKRRKWKGKLLPVLRTLLPFVGEDASRSWASGVQLDSAVARATNNVVIAECDAAFPLTGVTLPSFAVQELLRLDVEPIGVAAVPNAVTFYLPGDVWLRTNLIADAWPQSAPELVAALHKGRKLRPVPPGLLDAVTLVAPFCADLRAPVVMLREGEARTTGATLGAFVGGFKGLGDCAFRVEPLLDVLRIATAADWSAFPRVPWAGEGVRGAIVGLQL